VVEGDELLSRNQDIKMRGTDGKYEPFPTAHHSSAFKDKQRDEFKEEEK
jgi:hypothetical protein